MGIGPKLSGHWTDEQMIDHLYGIGPEDNHLSTCQDCHGRVAAIQARRQSLESTRDVGDEISFSFLATQRRQIYARLEQPASWPASRRALRWASAAAALVVVGGGLTFFEQERTTGVRTSSVQTAGLRESDAQLAEDVSSLANAVEPSATGPLQALFAE
jgi:hypothetical protein